MTIEEAGEILLAAKKYDVCRPCEGAGSISITIIHDETSIEECKACGGRGRLLNAEYKSACRVVGIPEPELPSKKSFAEAWSAQWQETWRALDAMGRSAPKHIVLSGTPSPMQRDQMYKLGPWALKR